MRKHEDERTSILIIHEGIGKIAEGDIKYASGDADTVIIGFNVGTDTAAKELAERTGVEISSFSIIYDLTDWIEGAIEARRPKIKKRGSARYRENTEKLLVLQKKHRL